MTLPELVMGIAVAAMVGLVATRFFLALVKVSAFSLRQAGILATSRQALSTELGRPGLVWATQEASEVAALSTNTLSLALPAGAAATYSVSTGTLLHFDGTSTSVQAPNVTALSLTYYSMDSNGLIFESTQAETAAYVAALLTVAGTNRTDKTYYIYSGAWLRNP